MRNRLVEPRPGEAITAAWAAELVRELRSQRPIAGPGMRVARGPNGTTFSAAAGPQASGRGDLSCFRIAGLKYTESSGTISAVEVKLANLFYRIDGKTYELEVEEEEEEVEEEESEGEEEEEEAEEEGVATVSSSSAEFVIALRCEVTDGSVTPSAELVVLPSIARLQAEERNRNYYHDPIWLFRDFAPAVDLRTAPRMIMTEF